MFQILSSLHVIQNYRQMYGFITGKVESVGLLLSEYFFFNKYQYLLEVVVIAQNEWPLLPDVLIGLFVTMPLQCLCKLECLVTLLEKNLCWLTQSCQHQNEDYSSICWNEENHPTP